MNQLKEWKEAKAAGQEALEKVDRGMKLLKKASSWGFMDLFSDSFFLSFIKRRKIKKANKVMKEIVEALHNLNRELGDVNVDLPEEINDKLSDKLLDMWFDNIFTDIRVQGELKRARKKLKEIRKALMEVMKTLDHQR